MQIDQSDIDHANNKRVGMPAEPVTSTGTLSAPEGPSRTSYSGPLGASVAKWLVGIQTLSVFGLALWMPYTVATFVGVVLTGSNALQAIGVTMVAPYPLTLIACTAASWWLYRRGDHRRSLRGAWVPLLTAVAGMFAAALRV